MGALGAAVLALLNRKLSFKNVKEVARGTFRITGFIFRIWVSATVFVQVMHLIGFPLAAVIPAWW